MSRRHSAAFHRPDRGASAVEYALMVAAIAVVITAVVFGFGRTIGGVLSDTTRCIEAREAAAGPFPDC